jgi:hypothetical protein
LIKNVFLSVKLFITGLAVIATYVYADKVELLVNWVPVVAVPMVVYVAMSAMEVTIEASAETVLMCLCEDVGEGLYTPNDLEDVAKWLQKKKVNSLG